jgi:predicted O-methyltransferase YrrM
MNVAEFQRVFAQRFNRRQRNLPSYEYWDPLIVAQVDPCPDVAGMLSVKKQQLLRLAFGLLEESEAYLEVGTYHGKSLLSAMLDNPVRPVFACDNFSEFEDNSFETAQENLRRYGLLERVVFYNCDFRGIFNRDKLPVPIGLYFYDGAHDFESQHVAIKLVEPFLADEALVLVDDWRFEPDSGSHAKAATLKAAEESCATWQLLHELPARFNGDRAMWWNGVGVLAFYRNGVPQ